MSPSPRRNAPTREQAQASDPGRSTWVSASAGSGKTFVLARRVLRLLRAGTPPGRILCLTFTRAAAAEMETRIFRELAQWATLPDAALADALADIEGRAPARGELEQARTLFAHALETPGGLKIQTIHAFCERVLHQFPFEANVPAHFEVLDDAAAAELRQQAQSHVLGAAMNAPAGPLAVALDTVSAHAGEQRFGDLIQAVIARQADLNAWTQVAGGLKQALPELARALGADADADTGLDALHAELIASPIFPHTEWTGAASLLATGKDTDRKCAAALETAWRATGPQRRDAYMGIFLKQDGEPRARLVTKAISDAHPELAEMLSREQARIVVLRQRIKAQQTYAASAALLRLGDAVLGHYASLKQRRGLLAYDDLIERTLTLLSRAEAAQWVLYKLDGGIDHILVDEAQDTSPAQWEIVRHLTEEALSGEGARNLARTVFAVGDEKQSIYSFQGADPVKFDEMRRFFAHRVVAAGKAWAKVPLNVSFRSGPAVLEAVDRVFATPAAHAGLVATGEPVAHVAQRRDAPGLVEIWPTEKPDKKSEPDPWDAPLDQLSAESPRARLAQRIAGTIAGWIRDAVPLEGRGRAVSAGDILILVRRRNELVDALVAALRGEGVAVAGADRLVLRDHIAVMDLMAAGDVALLPDDDLTLACLLKSPLAGLGEDDLYDLAAGRAGSLWQALKGRRNEAAFAVAHDFVAGLLTRADFAPPFDFYAQLLGADGGRARLVARLGPEAADAIGEFLNLALHYEQGAVPSLQGFLHWMREQRADIKRNMDQARGEVRIMTVHGAKGLEAPIVILADTCDAPNRRFSGPLLALPAPSGAPGAARPLVWAAGRQQDHPDAVLAARERSLADQMAEYRRLLYVAMTRAEDRLYICGAETGNGRADGCWYDLISAALLPVMTQVSDGDGTPLAWRLVRGTARGGPVAALAPAPAGTSQAALPDWAMRPAVPEPERPRLLRPSSLDADDAMPTAAAKSDGGGPGGPGAQAARERGTLIHRLLERLPDVPAHERHDAATRLLAALAPDLGRNAAQAMAREVIDLIADPRLAPLFAPEALAEVAISGPVGVDGTGRPLHVSGQIDRLVVRDDHVLIADYKTNRQVPRGIESVPPATIAQLAAYAHAVRLLYPDRPARALIVWTAGPEIMEIPGAILQDADFPAFAQPAEDTRA